MKLYDTLGVAPTASAADIKAAFRKKASEAHPDREGGSTEAMAAINEAWTVLGDPERRKQYDQTGDTREPPKERTMEERGGAALAEVFASCLTKDGDIVEAVRKIFNQGIDSARTEHITLGQLERKLDKRRGLVISVKGENIFAILLDGKIAEVQRKRENLLDQIAEGEAALTLLKDYRFTGEPTPVQRPYNPHSTLTALMLEDVIRGMHPSAYGGFDFGRGS